jgi:rubredoxin
MGCIGFPEHGSGLHIAIDHEQKEILTMDKWECMVCGYVYDPAENDDVPFENLPDDWTCPDCGAGKDMFEKLS